MDGDIEQLGRLASVIVLAAVGVFLLLQALLNRRRPADSAEDVEPERDAALH